MTPVEQIKEHLSIIDVVSAYIKIEKAGVNFKARCPFHNERTASFFVSPGRNTYHCFGCNRGGDIFSFVEEIEGVSFPEALKILGNKAGVNIDFKGPRNNNEIYYKILEEAVKFYAENLKNNDQAMNYLASRGLNPKTIEEFKLGFAPNDWRILLTQLRSKKINDESIEKAGLAIKSEKNVRDKYYDRFRSRIMFPIFDGQGRAIGFSGRIFPDDPKTSKYVNSPETVLYNKSKILYGYDKAKREILAKNFAILVEGQMDLVLAHQVGSINTVAVSGTALTEDHINLIKRFTDTLIFAFDSDEAGVNASLRSFKIALSKGMDIKVLSMPQGLDPADYILKDPDGWKRAIGEAKHIVDFYLDLVKSKGLSEREFQKEISKKVLPLVATIENKIDQAYFVKKIANITFLDENSIREELAKNMIHESTEAQKHENIEAPKHKIIDKVLGFFIWQEVKPKQNIDLNSFQKRFKDICGEEIKERVLKIDPAKRQDLSFEAEIYWAQSNDLKQAIDELLDNFEFEFLEDKLNKLMVSLKQIESPINMNKMKEEEEEEEEESTLLLKEYQRIIKRINEIKNKRHK